MPEIDHLIPDHPEVDKERAAQQIRMRLDVLGQQFVDLNDDGSGECWVTAGVQAKWDAPGYRPFVQAILGRYQAGDYGEVSPADAESNRQDRARNLGMQLASYRDPEGETLWIAQSLPGEKHPTILLPDEY